MDPIFSRRMCFLKTKSIVVSLQLQECSASQGEDSLEVGATLYAIVVILKSEHFKYKVLIFPSQYEGCADNAVDVGCGSGQSTIILSPHFKRVWGIDASAAQIREAEASRACHNITYSAAPAEILPFAENSVQLVTAGACLHWLQRDLFFTEVRRVLVNNGILAAYTYHSLRPLVEDLQWKSEIDSLYDKIFQELNSYWYPEVFVSLEKYKNVQFQFEEVFRIPDVRQTFDGRFEDVIGYVESFSAFQNMKKADSGKASRVLSDFSCGLQKILERSGTSIDGMLKLYRDFFITICRKIDK